MSKHSKRLRNLILLAVIGIPFFLYFAALNEQEGLVYLGLGAMGLCMLVTMKVG
jgi:hypothetical protein